MAGAAEMQSAAVSRIVGTYRLSQPEGPASLTGHPEPGNVADTTGASELSLVGPA